MNTVLKDGDEIYILPAVAGGSEELSSKELDRFSRQVMLEEIGYDYKVTFIDIGNDDQFKPEFKKISPFSKIPVIKDVKNNQTHALRRKFLFM